MMRSSFDTSLHIPNQFGNFPAIKILGRGGKSAVYLAYDDDLDRPVALKFPNASGMHEAEILERFKREAKAKELSSLVFRRH